MSLRFEGRFLGVIAVAVGLTASAAAQAAPDKGALKLRFGESVTLTFRQLGGMLLQSVQPGDKGGKGTLVFSLTRSGDMRILAVKNTLEGTVRYDCWLNFGGREASTTIVPVMPLGIPFMETWQDNFDSVTIRNIRVDRSESSRKATEIMRPYAPSAKEGGGTAAPTPAAPSAAQSPGAAPVAERPEPQTSPQDALTAPQRAELAAAFERALLLHEMDTVLTTARATLEPAIQKAAPAIPPDATDIGLVSWMDGEAWESLFFYTGAGTENYPIAGLRLEPPIYRGSPGESRAFDLASRKPVEGPARDLAKAYRIAAGVFRQSQGVDPWPDHKCLTVQETDGTATCYFLPVEGEDGPALLGPDLEVKVALQDGAALWMRRPHRTEQTLRRYLLPGEMTLPPDPEIHLSTALPQAEDILLLLLHPDLSPVPAVSPLGRFTLRAGLLPEFGLPPAPAAAASAAAAGIFSVVKGDKKDLPALMPEILEGIRKNAGAMFFRSWHIREARQMLLGAIDCPLFPEAPDPILTFLPGSGEEKSLVVFFVHPGRRAPCAAVRVDVPPDGGGGWRYTRMRPVPEPPDHFQIELELTRAAKRELDARLGPGLHYYFVVPGPEPNSGMVYAWSEIERKTESRDVEDRFLVGSLASVMLMGKPGQLKSVGQFVLDTVVRGWQVKGLKEPAPLGIVSAADPEHGFFGEMDILRCRLTPWLCPRLIKSGQEELYLVQGDGSYRLLSKREAKKVRSLDPALYPKVVFQNKPLEDYKADPRVVKGGGE